MKILFHWQNHPYPPQWSSEWPANNRTTVCKLVCFGFVKQHEHQFKTCKIFLIKTLLKFCLVSSRIPHLNKNKWKPTTRHGLSLWSGLSYKLTLSPSYPQNRFQSLWLFLFFVHSFYPPFCELVWRLRWRLSGSRKLRSFCVKASCFFLSELS